MRSRERLLSPESAVIPAHLQKAVCVSALNTP